MNTVNTYLIIDRAATGKNISHLMKSNNVTVRELRQYLGFSTGQAIYKWRNGLNLPTIDNFLLLSYLWDIPINDILRFKIIEYERSEFF